MARLDRVIRQRKIITVELIPDRVSPADLAELRDRVDAVTIPALRNGTDDPVYRTGFHVTPQQRSIAAATLLRGTGVEAVPTITCRDTSIDELFQLRQLKSNGIENLLVVYGDPHETVTYDKYEVKTSPGLIKRIVQTTNGGPSVIAITNQYAEDSEREVEKTIEREDAGARLILTNAVFEADGLLSYRDRLRAAGLKAPLSVQISIIHSPNNLSFIKQKLGIPVPVHVERTLRANPRAGVKVAAEAFEVLRREFEAVHFSYLYRGQSPVPVYNQVLDLAGIGHSNAPLQVERTERHSLR